MPDTFFGGKLNVRHTGRLTAQWIISGIDASTMHDRLVLNSSILPLTKLHPHGTVTVDHATVVTSRGGECGQVSVEEPCGVESKYWLCDSGCASRMMGARISVLNLHNLCTTLGTSKNSASEQVGESGLRVGRGRLQFSTVSPVHNL